MDKNSMFMSNDKLRFSLNYSEYKEKSEQLQHLLLKFDTEFPDALINDDIDYDIFNIWIVYFCTPTISKKIQNLKIGRVSINIEIGESLAEYTISIFDRIIHKFRINKQMFDEINFEWINTHPYTLNGIIE